MGKIKKFLDMTLMAILVIQGFSLVFIITISVFYRYVLGSALSWPEELAGILFVWYTLLGIVVLVGSDSHIAFDLVEKYAPPIASKAVKLFSQLIVVLYGLIMIVYGWKYLQLFPHETSPAAGIDLKWVKISIPATGILLVIYVLMNIFNSEKNAGSKEG